jgi:hypothetical protein
MADPDEEIEFAERAKREPARTRQLRRAGAGLAFVAAALCVCAMLGGRWWWLEFGDARMYVGITEVRLCDPDDHCQNLHRDELAGYLTKLRGGTKADAAVVDDWLASGPSAMLGFLGVAAAFLGGIAVLSQRHKGTRVAAITAGIIALMSMVPVWRFGRSAPIFLFHRGIHAYVGLAAVLVAFAAAALVALPAALVTPPTARVVKRG